VIWTPGPGELVVLLGDGPDGIGADSVGLPGAPVHAGQVGLVLGWLGDGLLEVLWPDGSVTGVWAGLGRIRPLAAEEAPK